jgi:hypothetical protein
MTYSAAEGRQQLLDEMADAADEMAVAIAALGGAYELLDEVSGDRLEEALFRPAQLAYGRLKRAHAAFAERHGLPARSFAAAESGAPSHGVAGFVEVASQAAERADLVLAELQDSMLPVEVGDADLRAALAEVRRLIGTVPQQARELQRTLGR